VSVNEKKWLVMHMHVQLQLDDTSSVVHQLWNYVCESVAKTIAHLQTVQFGHWHLSLTPCPLDLSYTTIQ
jgi:hypothetical protein